jgi:hypothetical protein
VATDDLVERLSAIAEELGDLAFDQLREASARARDGSAVQSELVDAKKRLTRARRSVEKAIAVLRGPTELD